MEGKQIETISEKLVDKNYIRPKLCVFDLVGWFHTFCFQSV